MQTELFSEHRLVGGAMFHKPIVLLLCGLVSLFMLAPASLGATNFFQPVQHYASGGWRAVSTAIADVNGDGKLDLLVANQCVADDNCDLQAGDVGRGAIGVLIGKGDGTFQPARIYLSGGYAATTIVVADLNGDGRVDLAVGHQCGDRDCSGKTVVGVLL